MSGGGLMEQIYREIIMERSQRPRHRGEPGSFTHRHDGLNPSCGDELTLYLDVKAGFINEARFTGQGCAISQASADLMASALTGVTVEQALQLSASFRSMLRGDETDVKLGDLEALAGVRKLHARVRCANLAWVTLEEALSQ